MDLLDYLRTDIAYIAVDLFALLVGVTAIGRGAFKAATLSTAIFLALKLIIFVGLRPVTAGNDTEPYFRAFQAIIPGDIAGARRTGTFHYGNTDYSGIAEFLYWPSVALFKTLTESFTAFLIATILISATLVFHGNRLMLKFFSDLPRDRITAFAMLLTYLAFLTYEIAYFGGHIRAAIGVPMAFLSFVMATRGRILATATLFVLSLGFHNSAMAIVPLLVLQLLRMRVVNSRKTTAIVTSALAVAYVIGQFDLISRVLQILGGYYYDRYTDYAEYTGFNVTSIFQTAFFWIILLHIVVFLVVGYREIHMYAFYFMALMLIFLSTPKISERYFEYILLCLPLLLFISLRMKFRESTTVVLCVVFYFATGLLVVTSDGLLSTLEITSFLLGR